MNQIILAFTLFTASAMADHAPAGYHAPAHAAPAYHAPAHHAPTHYDESPQPYAYQYGVSDEYSGVNIAAEESADGKVTHGSYKVALPDTRVKTVSYTVDGYNGFVADVHYDGTPVYDSYAPSKQHHKSTGSYHEAPAPSYRPAPVPAYKPAPAPTYKAAPAPSYKPTPIPSYKPTYA